MSLPDSANVPLLFLQFVRIVQEKGEIGRRRLDLAAAEHQDAELEPPVNVGEDLAPVLEIVEPDQRFGIDEFGEELAGSVVGGDAGGHQQPDAALGGDDSVGQFGKDHVGVHVALGRQGEIARAADVGQGLLGAIACLDVGGIQFGIGRLEPFDKLSAAGRVDRAGDFGGGEGEKLPLLEFHPLPGRIADDAIEARIAGPRKTSGNRRFPLHGLVVDRRVGDEAVLPQPRSPTGRPAACRAAPNGATGPTA